MIALLGYLLVGVAVLAPSLRPGHTLAPADVVTAVQPYNQAAGGIHDHNPAVSDGALQVLPWLHFLTTTMHHGHLPQWNPQLLGGVRVVPNGFFASYYPPTWLARWLSADDFYSVFVLIHLVIGALGVYAFSRVLGARRVSSWLAGLLVFASAFWIHWSLHPAHLVGMVGTPWALAAVHLVVRRPSSRRVAALAVVFGLWWLGANPQYAYYGTLAMGAYGLALLVQGRVVEQRPLVRPALAVGAGLALGAALAAPSLLPSAAMTSMILRNHEPPSSTVDTHLHRADAIRLLVNEARGNPPDHIVTAADPESLMDSPFVGITALVLAAAGAASRGRYRWLLLGGAVGALVLGFTGPPHQLLYHLPGYDRFRVSARWLAVLPAFALPLSALGLDALLDGDRRPRLAAVGAAVLGLLAVLAWWLHQRGESGAPHPYLSHRAALAALLLIAVAGGALLARRRPSAAIAVMLVCAAVEVFFHTPRWYPDVTKSTAYPPVAATTIARSRGGRLVHMGDGPPTPLLAVAPDIPMMYGVSDVQGFAVFIPKAVDRYLRLVHDYGSFAGLQNTVPAFPTSTLRSPLLEALDARTVVSSSPVAGVDPVGAEPPADYVYAGPTAGPAQLVPRAQPVDEPTMWRAVADPGWDPRATAAVLGLGSPIEGAPGVVRRVRASTDGDEWAVHAPGGGFLRVSSNWDAGWRATVDGRPARVLRADGIFRGVAVPAGDHTIRFSYRNPDVERGLRLAVASLIVIVALLVAGTRQERAGARQERARVLSRRPGASGGDTPARQTAARTGS